MPSATRIRPRPRAMPPPVFRLNKALVSEWCFRWAAFPWRAMARRELRNSREALEPLVQSYDAILMANHGVVTYGQDLLTAFFRMETTEHFAHVALVTELLGKQVLLSGEDVEKLLAARARYGMQTARRPDPNVRSPRMQSER